MKVYNIDGTEKAGNNDIKLPGQFSEEIREDLIKLAVLAIQSRGRQPYGAKPDAGKRASAEISRRRRAYRGAYGHGISRVPRKIMTRRGTRMYWVGAAAPGTVGGRKAHPPKASKVWAKKVNDKMRKKAICGAMAASVTKELVEKRGHKVPENYPFLVNSSIEALEKTKQVKEALEKLRLSSELLRTKAKTIRAGKGKMRGRKYKQKTGPLLVVSGDCKLLRSACNIPGVDVVNVRNINAELLAPGCMPGRLTLYTDKAIEILSREKLFM